MADAQGESSPRLDLFGGGTERASAAAKRNQEELQPHLGSATQRTVGSPGSNQKKSAVPCVRLRFYLEHYADKIFFKCQKGYINLFLVLQGFL